MALMFHERHERLWVRREPLSESEYPEEFILSFDMAMMERRLRKKMFFNHCGGDLTYLTDEVLDWCLDHTPTVRIDMNPYYGKAIFNFRTSVDAVQFKLRWC